MTITQNQQNAIIKWNGGFNIGANGTVNFDATNKDANGKFNTLNYDSSGQVSQIYGKLNAQNGNIYIVNPNGVQIGNSAQINVGSLYVSNQNLEGSLDDIQNQDIGRFLEGQKTLGNGELMSLGHINAPEVTFVGNRVVIDMDRLANTVADGTQGKPTLVVTSNSNDIVLGGNETNLQEIMVNGSGDTAQYQYQWIETAEDLKGINDTNNRDKLNGKYALRNSIDLTDQAFTPIGDSTNAFKGKFDGLGFNIFGLSITGDENYTGLFGYTDGATIRSFNLIAGEATKTDIQGGNYTGSLIGYAKDTTVKAVTSTLDVTGAENVGGLIGYAENSTLQNVINTGVVSGQRNVGGIVGNLQGGTLGVGEDQSRTDGETHNLGKVSESTAAGSNTIGGLVGYAKDATIGSTDNAKVIYNNATVEGGYTVGGIVGKMEGTTVQNVQNNGEIRATGSATEEYKYHTDNPKVNSEVDQDGNHYGKVFVHVANVGGIAGEAVDLAVDGGTSKKSQISSATNLGNVHSSRVDKEVYYGAGNIGGIVGRAEQTDITNVTNKESNIYGAHNVGGIAGYFSGGTISDATNNGGDIMATGARWDTGDTSNEFKGHNANGFATELIRADGQDGDTFIIGNMGGIVGYMVDSDSYIQNASNRGTVHSLEITNANDISDSSKAANVGGIVGKVDRIFSEYVKSNDLEGYLSHIKDTPSEVAIRDSYNTGEVQGYAGIGGIAGFMYNGEIINSYNIGNIKTTRISAGTDAANIGGILGDTMERSPSRVVLYNVYNKGTIGDASYTYYGRHVGGVAGRFSGIIDTAYNAGNIYNGMPVNGGIVGYWLGGTIQNVFNTGNIDTRINRSAGEFSSVGGIVGSIRGYTEFLQRPTDNQNSMVLKNAYNLGVLRSLLDYNGNHYPNSVAGIVGTIRGTYPHADDGSKHFAPVHLTISNVYSTGDLFAYSRENGNGEYTYHEGTDKVHVIINKDTGWPQDGSIENNRYTGFAVNPFDTAYYIDTGNNTNVGKEGISQDHIIQYVDSVEYAGNLNEKFSDFDTKTWRFYDGTTPILNAFMPKLGKDDNQTEAGLQDVKIQFGTAYNPFLSIIKTKTSENVTINDANKYINNWDSIAVYGGGLTLNGFRDVDGRMYGGTLYSDGALVVYDHSKFGAASHLYGSSVTIGSSTDTKLDLKINGTIQATGNADGSIIKDDKNGQVNITDQSVQSVESYGTISSAKTGETVTINGIKGNGAKEDGTNKLDFKNVAINDPKATMPTVASQYGHEYTSKMTGEVNITADGDVNLLYGNMHQGIVNAYGGLNVKSQNGAIYIDSDLNAGGKVTLTGDHEMLLDVSNIGKVSNPDDTVGTLHKFLDKTTDVEFSHVTTNDKNPIDGKIAIDMSSDDGKTLDFKKYDTPEDGNTPADTLAEHIKKLNANFKFNGQSNQDDQGVVKVNAIYTWISNADQLNDVQTYREKGSQSGILGYNFALKNNVDASGITDYKAIESTGEYTGIFDGRDQRLIGLSASEGIFGTIGDKGTVKNLKVYSSGFSGDSQGNGGVIANTNKGTISNVIGLGNTVSGSGTIGGLVGTNTGTIQNSSDQSSVIGAGGTVGGLAGTNQGKITGSMTNSAITGSGSSMGGIAGTNDTNGIIYNVSSNGVSGETGSTNIGGIVGTNNSTGGNITIDGQKVTGISNAYNNSVIRGTTDVGGIVGVNSKDATISNVANGTRISGDDASTDVGGLAGTNSGSIKDGRNTGTITGNKNVGGLVGVNESGSVNEGGSTLTNLENGPSASIKGTENVGGIAGTNKGSINAEDSELTNEGIIKGNTYVGGVAGTNEGTIKGVHSDITLQVNTDDGKKDGEYFGGIAGWNKSNGTITNATNTADINALTEEEGYGVSYVGGIAGWNDGTLQGASNEGNVTGKSFVGGVAGLNTHDIKGDRGDASEEDKKQEDILISNSGNVSATKGGAGGIFGENQGAIGDGDGYKHIILSNSGNVKGQNETENQGTGGVIGVNKGDISHTSLRNEVKWDEASKQYTPGNVTGTNNVGGVIGLNYGKVSGGRNVQEESIKDVSGDEIGKAAIGSYYKYQILNNGAVFGTSQVGGLIGKNMAGKTEIYEKNVDGATSDKTIEKTLSGAISAGYNTGSVTATGSNVGGIVGSNAKDATVDQVFSTLAKDTDGKVNQITGTSNVGGVVGNNEGTLTNSYATDAIGTGAGNLVGTNSGTISNVYSSADEGQLIGAGTTGGTVTNAYSFSKDDTNQHNVKVVDPENRKKQNGYSGFDFDKSDQDGTDNFWKLYEGNSNPLLKVFLNRVNVDAASLGSDGRYHVTYKGEAYSAEALRDKLHAANGKDFTEDKNTGNQLLKITGETILNAGDYDDVFWSQQIVTNGIDGNPNNLGYDVNINVTVDRAKLTVTGTDVKHVYGNQNLSEGTSYGATITGWVGKDQGTYHLDNNSISDGGLVTGSTVGKVTQNVNYRSEQDKDNPYTWTGRVTLEGDLAKNYTFDSSVAPDNATSRAVDISGASYITPAQLTIHADDTYVPVGIKPHYSGTVDTLVNGDQWDAHFGIASSDKPKESQVGVYHGIIGLWVDGTFHGLKENDFTEGFLKNYNITLEPGTLTVGDWPSWDYFLKDAPWDRQKNFRERKAEIHFIAGGMTL